MPIEQYQKDGRIIRGIQRGANSFTTSTAMAALELTSRLIHLIQVLKDIVRKSEFLFNANFVYLR